MEVESNGNFIVTKPNGTGGIVSFGTVSEQFLYEIGDPQNYILPDVSCDFTNVTIKEIGNDKVFVSGARGKPPSNTYKISATYLMGYRISIAVIIVGINAAKKAKVSAEAIIKKTERMFSDNDWSNYKIRKYRLLELRKLMAIMLGTLNPVKYCYGSWLPMNKKRP
ncbi:MAG: hypothetical protein CM1200mP10_08270 [Candidatus Neomarinimicrobiota bacterium]|nr:MAG: hypothetical protein CM1200mP10_08270 [Candidatus Neomarinimicrobiota bacterium]